MQYISIKEAIEEQIESGMLAEGQKLPSERTLAESFSTTRVTLREALQQLALLGKVYKEERKGWFVSASPLYFDPSHHFGFKKTCQQQKRACSVKQISLERTLASKEIATYLQLPPFSYVYLYITSVTLEGRKVALQYQYVPDIQGSALKEMLEGDDIISVLNKRCLYDADGVSFTFDIAPATHFESNVLRLSSSSMLLSVIQTVFNQAGTPFLLQKTRYCHDAIKIEVGKMPLPKTR